MPQPQQRPELVALLRDEWDIICRRAIDVDPDLGLALTGCRPFMIEDQQLLLQPVAVNIRVELLAPHTTGKQIAEGLIAEQIKEPIELLLVGRAEHGPSASMGLLIEQQPTELLNRIPWSVSYYKPSRQISSAKSPLCMHNGVDNIQAINPLCCHAIEIRPFSVP